MRSFNPGHPLKNINKEQKLHWTGDWTKHLFCQSSANQTFCPAAASRWRCTVQYAKKLWVSLKPGSQDFFTSCGKFTQTSAECRPFKNPALNKALNELFCVFLKAEFFSWNSCFIQLSFYFSCKNEDFLCPSDTRGNKCLLSASNHEHWIIRVRHRLVFEGNLYLF